MKKVCSVLFIALIIVGTLFAADSSSIKLQNTVDSSQSLQVLYDEVAIDGNDNADNSIVLTSGEAKPMAVKWIGNTNDDVKSMRVDIVTNGFVNKNAVKDEKPVSVLFVGEDIESTGDKSFAITDNGKTVGTVTRASAYGHCGVSYTAEPYTVGSYIIAEFTPTWDGNYNWTAGEYECVIEFYFIAP